MTDYLPLDEQPELLPEDIDDDGLDDSVSPDLGKLQDHDLPEYDNDVEFEGEDVYDDGDN